MPEAKGELQPRQLGGACRCCEGCFFAVAGAIFLGLPRLLGYLQPPCLHAFFAEIASHRGERGMPGRCWPRCPPSARGRGPAASSGRGGEGGDGHRPRRRHPAEQEQRARALLLRQETAATPHKPRHKERCRQSTLRWWTSREVLVPERIRVSAAPGVLRLCLPSVCPPCRGKVLRPGE